MIFLATQDRYFLQVARRFPDDRPLMLVAELDGQIIGAGFAFRRCSQPGEAVTLRNVAVPPPHDDIGLQRRLIRTIEQAAVRLVAGAGHPRRAGRGRAGVLPEHGLPRAP